MSDPVLIIDDDREVDDVVCNALTKAGVVVESVANGFSAIERLRQQRYSAVILDPMIRHGLNGYAVLNYIELEQPESIEHLFLLTGMSEQTIRRTAPAVLPRLFRKQPAEAAKLVDAVLSISEPTTGAPTQPTKAVLLVEDDHITAQAMTRLVQELGYAVISAHSVQEALHRLSECGYAAILLDLVMPEVDGFTLLEHLTITRPDLMRRVIVATGMPEKYVTTIYKHQICGMLQKPIDPAALSMLLERCVSHGTASFEPAGESPQIT